MVSVDEAQQAIRTSHDFAVAGEATPLSPAVLGQVLAEHVTSDVDQPPFDKAMMDGFAVRTSDFAEGLAELEVVEEITAGRMPTRAIGPGEASRIMTGAPIPQGCDAVVMIERSEMISERRVRIVEPKLVARSNILARCGEMQVGALVLANRTPIGPQELGLLAAVGRTQAMLIPRPAVAVIATGDEIVPAEQKPGPGQIRNSNAPMLLGQAARAGAIPRWLGIARDDTDHLRTMIEEGLRDSVLILSGGVSAGKLDLVPSVLESLGMRTMVRHVRMKPGKPMLFGIVPRPGKSPTLVFGLPGNPVSSMVCFELFVRPALRRLMGRNDDANLTFAKLVAEMTYRTDRPTYHPARIEANGSTLMAKPFDWFGSADLRGVQGANGFVIFPPGEGTYAAGMEMPALTTGD